MISTKIVIIRVSVVLRRTAFSSSASQDYTHLDYDNLPTDEK